MDQGLKRFEDEVVVHSEND